jgi:membrane protein required for colicin V production
MNGLDYTILCVVAISALVGLLRGFVRETVSLLVWIAAFWSAMSFSADVAVHMSGVIGNPSMRLAAAFIALFVAVLTAGVIVNYLLARLLKKAGVRTSDRLLGAVFGIARGALVVALVMVLVELTPLVESSAWQGSLIVGYLHPMLNRFHKLLPADPLASMAQGWTGSAVDKVYSASGSDGVK